MTMGSTTKRAVNQVKVRRNIMIAQRHPKRLRNTIIMMVQMENITLKAALITMILLNRQ